MKARFASAVLLGFVLIAAAACSGSDGLTEAEEEALQERVEQAELEAAEAERLRQAEAAAAAEAERLRQLGRCGAEADGRSSGGRARIRPRLTPIGTGGARGPEEANRRPRRAADWSVRLRRGRAAASSGCRSRGRAAASSGSRSRG